MVVSHKFGRSEPVGSTIEFLLNDVPTTTETLYLEEGSPLQLICSHKTATKEQGEPLWIYDGEYANKSKLFQIEKNDNNSKLTIPAFTYNHTGIYECSAIDGNGRATTKMMRLKVASKDTLTASSALVPCPKGPEYEDYCLNNGECFLLDDIVGCRCPPSFTGKRCTDPLQKQVPTMYEVPPGYSVTDCSSSANPTVLICLLGIIGILILIIIALVYLYRKKMGYSRDPDSPKTPLCEPKSFDFMNIAIPVNCAPERLWTQISRDRGAYSNVSNYSIYEPTEMQSPSVNGHQSTSAAAKQVTVLDSSKQTNSSNKNINRQRTESEKSYILAG